MRSARDRVRFVHSGLGLCGLLLTACGGQALKPSSDEPSPHGGGAGLAGAPASAQAGNSGSAAGLGPLAGAGGSAGSITDPAPVPPALIAGRWAMFNFEDPVGVQLTQSGSVLTGSGCAAGAPPLAEFAKGFCGAIKGEVVGNTATFGFPFEPSYYYYAQTTVSKDGRRMTGRFHAVGDLDSPTAWLRLADDQAFLPQALGVNDDPLSGAYQVKVIAASPGGSDYEVDKSYRLNYFRRGLSGDLGSFWHSETTDPFHGSPIHVGPVAETAPELPTAIELDFEDDNFTEIRATTPKGHTYTFRASRIVP
jgi:hypothetical protein